MTKYEKGKWRKRTFSSHACVIENGGLRINGINVTLYMDDYGIFVIKDLKGKIIRAKGISLKQLENADLDSIEWLASSIERTALLHNKFFKPIIKISSNWAYPDGTPNY